MRLLEVKCQAGHWTWRVHHYFEHPLEIQPGDRKARETNTENKENEGYFIANCLRLYIYTSHYNLLCLVIQRQTTISNICQDQLRNNAGDWLADIWSLPEDRY